MLGNKRHIRAKVKFGTIFSIVIAIVTMLTSVQLFAGQVGTTTGAFQTTPGGQSSYTMAVEVPPGIMGVVPQVAINYSSGGGVGLVGQGGSLSGLSAITRCGRTIASDGINQAVQYDSSDYFCLNGQRLILMSGSYGGNGSVYQTELESFQRITANGNIAGGPAYFEVLAKGGSKLVFGNSLSDTHLERSIDPVTGAVFTWGISHLEDKHGNRVVYEYADRSRTIGDETAAQIVPKRITYGHNANTDVLGELQVEFNYQIRPDVSQGYSRGQLHISDLRLANVKTYVGDDVVKDYRVSYDLSPTSGASRMTNITECSGEGNCLLPISFTWHNGFNHWKPVDDMLIPLLSATGTMQGVALDVNADGRTDWVRATRSAAGTETLETHINHHGNWSKDLQLAPPVAFFDYERNADGVAMAEIVDIDGDGRSDIVQAYQDANGIVNRVFKKGGRRWREQGDSLPTLLTDLTNSDAPKQLAEFVDLDGNSLPDLVMSYVDDGGQWHRQTWLNTTDGWQTSGSFNLPIPLIDYQLFDKGAATGFFIDVNSDGLVDLVQAYRSDTGDHLQTWLNTGAGWKNSVVHKLPIAIADYSQTHPQGLASPIDINGDGLVDIVRAHQMQNGAQSRKVWLNTGNGWRVSNDLVPPAVLWQQNGEHLQTLGAFMDMNGDGLTDLLLSYVADSDQQNTVWLNTGSGWTSDDSLAPPIAVNQLRSGNDSFPKAILLDVNADGQADLVQSSGGLSSSVWLNGVAGDLSSVEGGFDLGDVNEDPIVTIDPDVFMSRDYALPEVIIKFADGLENVYSVDYAPATWEDFYTPATDGSYPNIDIAGPMMLIRAVETSTGIEMSARAEHQYFGKKVNVLGYGDLGFSRKIATDTRTGAWIETQFTQQWPYIGSPVMSTKRAPAQLGDEQGVLLMRSVSTYATMELFGGKTFTTYQSLKTTTNYELDGSEIETSTNRPLSFDAYGHATSTETVRNFKGGDAPSIFRKRKDIAYTNDESAWQLGRVTNTTDTVTAPGADDISAHTSFKYYANGDLKEKTTEPGRVDWVKESYEYDDYGHITKTTISTPGMLDRVTTATYTDDGRFAATATNTLGHTASSEYHPFFGQVTRTEGPNGEVKKKLYDDHGRMIKATTVRSDRDSTAAEDQANNVVVFNTCEDNPSCPENAAYFLGVVDNEDESPETVYYDNRNREVRKQTQGFDGSKVFVDTKYDSFGRKHEISKPYFATDENTAIVFWAKYEYDLLGRVKKIITPAGKNIITEYSVGKTKVTNPAGQSKTTWVNGQGKPIKVQDQENGIIEYTYDAAGRLLTTTVNGDSNTTISLKYDHFGRKVRQDDPDLGVWTYGYDNLGQLDSQTDAKGQVVTMEYDLLGRIVKRIEADGITEWEYDTALNSEGEPNGLGKLTRVWNDQNYERAHIYDDYGRPTLVTTTIEGESTTIETKYVHTTDRVAYVKYPSGLQIEKTYNNYGFPLAIRSSSLDYKDRYLAAEAEATELAALANDYKESTADERQGYLDTYEDEKDLGEAIELEITAEQANYRRELRTYNRFTDRQRKKIDTAKHYERWGKSFQEVALHFQKYAIIHVHGAEVAIAIIETREPDWASMRYPEFGIDEHDVINHIAPMWGVSPSTLGHAFDMGRDKKAGAAWAESFAKEAERLGGIAAHNMADANLRFNIVKRLVEEAEGIAEEAQKFYDRRMQPIVDIIEAKVDVANGHYEDAKDAAEEVNRIDEVLKAKIDLAVNAQRQAEALKNYHENVASELHWRAEVVDAAGKVTKFLQGTRVSTDVTYEASTGRLLTVMANSTPVEIELESGETVPTLTNRLNAFIAELEGLRVESSANAISAQAELDLVSQQIDALDPNDPELSDALKRAVEAQLDALAINEAILETEVSLNEDINVLAQSSLGQAASIKEQFAGLEATTNNSLVYSAKVNHAIANYHQSLNALYEYAASQHSGKASEIVAMDAVDEEFLEEYADLGTYHEQLAAQLQSRADAIVVDDGSSASTAEDYGLAKAANRQKRLIDSHADVSAKRRRINIALFAPLQEMNKAGYEHHSLLATGLAEHFAQQTLLGRSDRERFKMLERLYRDRLSVLESSNQEDVDIFANDTERKALYQYMADINAELGTMYTDMSDATYWTSMYGHFADALSDKSGIYSQLASNHQKIADNHALLANKSSEKYDHTLLSDEDGTILNDSYEWDDIGNLLNRRHEAAGLFEEFEYDNLNRLTSSSIAGNAATPYVLNGSAEVTYEYDALGNIRFKSDVGSYNYNHMVDGNYAGPHAVSGIVGDVYIGQKMTTSYAYDANGNMLSGDGRTISYTSFNKPASVTRGSEDSRFTYGPERQLVKQIEFKGGDEAPITTTYFGGQYERIYDGHTTTEKYHLRAHGGGTIAVIIDKEDEIAPKTHYLHRDHLDSIVAITNEQGHIVERFFYDAFGKQYAALTLEGDELYANTLDYSLTNRGFTGHRLIQTGLIHMKGRVYDPEIGRFLSADPHIQFAGNAQNYNRYSYVNNNPLAFTDPSGYFLSSIFKAIKKLFKKLIKIIKKVIEIIKKVVKFIKENLRVIIAVVVAVAVVASGGALLGALGATGAAAGGGAFIAASGSLTLLGSATIGAIAGGLSGLITTGSLSGMLKGAAFGFIGGGIAHGINAAGIGQALKLGTNVAQGVNAGLTGGIMSKITGGSFSKGFKNALITFGILKGINESTGVFTKIGNFAKGLFNNPAGQPTVHGEQTLSASADDLSEKQLMAEFMNDSRIGIDGELSPEATIMEGKIGVYEAGVTSAPTESAAYIEEIIVRATSSNVPEAIRLISAIDAGRTLIVINNQGINLAYTNNRILTIDPESDVPFIDARTGRLSYASYRRILLHELTHGVVGLTDGNHPFHVNDTVRFTDSLLRGMGGRYTTRGRYTNDCYHQPVNLMCTQTEW